MTITALPIPPTRSDPANFADRADAFLAALPTFVTEANATAVAMNLNSTTDTSSSSVAIGTGARSFTVTADKSWQLGMYLIVADSAAPGTNSMYGQVTSYSGTSLTLNVISTRGSGTKTAWTISQSAAGGAQLGANNDITSLSALATVPTVVTNAITAAAPAASDTVEGKIRTATSAENIAGVLQGVAVDPLGIREAFNASGAAPVYACRAWVNFNGTGTPTIRASGNVSSITDFGVGDYGINFVIAMPDNDYAFTGTVRGDSDSSLFVYTLQANQSTGKTTSQLVVKTKFSTNGAAFGNFDSADISVAVFR